MSPIRTSLRKKILFFVSTLILLSLLGSAISLYQITRVNLTLNAINEVSVPLGQLLARIKWDADVLKREMKLRLGYSRWNHPNWKPKPVPRWIEEVIEGEIERADQLVESDSRWASGEQKKRWKNWTGNAAKGLRDLRIQARKLYQALKEKKESEALEIYPYWVASLNDWTRVIELGVREAERFTQASFSEMESQVEELRTILTAVLVVVLLGSLLMLWFGDRALRPLVALTNLVREITRRGIEKADKERLPQVSPDQGDEVSELAREFQRMASSLLEREKTVSLQQTRLSDQNKLLRKMISEQEEMQKKLTIAENLAAVGRMSAQVAHEVRNPLHSIGLEAEMALELLTQQKHQTLKQSLQSILSGVDRLENITDNYLKLSQLSKGEREKVNMAEIVQTTLATYAAVFETDGVEVSWTQEQGALPFVWGDSILLEQALGNLIRNSLQAIEDQELKKIEVQVGNLETGQVFLRIQDNGAGVPPELESKLFSPFFTTKAQGTGLGLPFVKKVIENHGGEVEFLKKEGSGAIFLIRLPGYLKTNQERISQVGEEHTLSG